MPRRTPASNAHGVDGIEWHCNDLGERRREGREICLLLALASAKRRLLLGFHAHNHPEAELLLVRAVERLGDADPGRVESGIRSELGGSCLSQKAPGMRRRNTERLEVMKLARGNRRADRPFAIVDREVVIAADRV